MLNEQQATDLVTRRARVRVGDAQRIGTFVEGEVIAYSRVPQILVRTDAGDKSWWNVNLPIAEVHPERESGCDRRADGLICPTHDDPRRAEPTERVVWMVKNVMADGSVSHFTGMGLLTRETAKQVAAELNGKHGIRSVVVRQRISEVVDE